MRPNYYTVVVTPVGTNYHVVYTGFQYGTPTGFTYEYDVPILMGLESLQRAISEMPLTLQYDLIR